MTCKRWIALLFAVLMLAIAPLGAYATTPEEDAAAETDAAPTMETFLPDTQPAEDTDAAVTEKSDRSAERGPRWWNDLKASFKLNFIDGERWRWLVEGLAATLEITAAALVIGIAIGVVIAAVRSSFDKNKAVLRARGGVGYALFCCADALCRLYLTVIRGTPVVVQLLICYFVIFANISEGVPIAIIAFGMNSGAYVAEIFRGGIMSIDEGQFEAGRSLGFNYVQTMRYIVLPQVFKVVLPTLCNEFIVLLKETSVAGYVGIMDLTKAGDLIRGRTFSAFLPLLAVAGIYLLFVVLLTYLVGKLERRLRSNER